MGDVDGTQGLQGTC